MKTALERLNGIINAKVNFKDSKATIRYYPDEVSVEDMINAVKKAGYGAAILK